MSTHDDKENREQPTPPQEPGSTAGPIPFPEELAVALGIPRTQKQDFPLICPHCGKPVREVLWRTFGNPGTIAIVGCGECRKVLGAHLLPHIVY